MRALDEPAPAKLNLNLRITGRRLDGYHELDSCVVFTAWADRVRVARAPRLGLEVVGPFAAALAAQPDNLILRAARHLAAYAGRAPEVQVVLDKRIPVAAGLGGGSADAAAALRALNRLWQLGLATSELCALALELGADVPMCVLGRPARMRGIGERLEPIALPPLELILANPGRAVATAQVFAGLGPIATAPVPPPPPSGGGATLIEWLRACGNDLEAPARQLAPEIDQVLAAIGAQAGCQLARMSGSGATCFGVFAARGAARRGAAALRQAHPGWWVISTTSRS